MTLRLWRRIGPGKFLFAWGLGFLYAFFERPSAPPDLTSRILAVLNDQYYIVFAVLPILLFILGSAMEEDPLPVLIRFRSYGAYFLARLRALGTLATLLWAGELLALAAAAWGAPLSGLWPDQSQSHGLWQDVFQLLETRFPSPVVALLASSAWLLMGFWLTALLCLWLGHFLSRTRGAQILMLLYVFAILQLKLPILSKRPFVYLTGLSHWNLLLHNLTTPGRLLVTLCFTAALIGLITWQIRFHWQEPKSRPRPSNVGLLPLLQRQLFQPKHILCAAIPFLLLAAWTLALRGTPESGHDWTLRLLTGHGNGNFYFMGLMSQILVHVLPLWPLGQLFSWTLRNSSCIFLVRLRRKTDLLYGLCAVSLLWLLTCLALLLTVETLPLLIFRIAPDVPFLLWTALLRLLDNILQVLLLLTLLCLTGQTASAFVLLTAAHMLTSLPIPLLPVGLSSLLRLSLPETQGAISPAGAFTILILSCILLLFWLRRYGVRLLFQQNGG